MRINPKALVVTLALTTTLVATSAIAAVNRPRDASPGDHASREPNPIVRIIKNIKHRFAQIQDAIILPPPAPTP